MHPKASIACLTCGEFFGALRATSLLSGTLRTLFGAPFLALRALNVITYCLHRGLLQFQSSKCQYHLNVLEASKGQISMVYV